MANRRQRHAPFERPSHSGWFQRLEGGVKTPAGVSGASHPARPALDWGEARDGEQSQTFDIAPEAVDGAVHIVPRSLRRPLFAETIIPPEVLDTLPTLPDDDYPVGVLVFLTTDAKLYRNTDGSTWSVEVDGADIIANSITAGQIAAGAIGTSELAADAVIANVANVGDTVVIDSTGIAIQDGALTFFDLFGENVLSGAGFGTSWYDFIAYGLYNATFAGGTTNEITAVTTAVDPDTEAEYLDSLSPDIPYWAVTAATNLSATRHLKRFATVSSSSGYVLQWVSVAGATMTAEIMQDIPVIPGQRYNITLNASRSAGSWTDSLKHKWIGADRSAVGSLVTEVFPTLSTSLDTHYVQTTDVAPNNARYLRVWIRCSSGSTGLTNLASVMVKPAIFYGRQYIMETGDSVPGDEPKLEFWRGKSDTRGAIVIDPYTGITFQEATGTAETMQLYKSGTSLYLGTGTANDVRLNPGGISEFPLGFKLQQGSGSSLTAWDNHTALEFDTSGTAVRLTQNGTTKSLLIRGDAGSPTSGGLTIAGRSSTTTMSGNVHNHNNNNDDNFIIRLEPSGATRNLTGLVAPGGATAGGTLHIIANESTTQSLLLSHENANSSAANRFWLPNGADVTILPRGGRMVYYDSGNSRWRQVGP